MYTTDANLPSQEFKLLFGRSTQNSQMSTKAVPIVLSQLLKFRGEKIALLGNQFIAEEIIKMSSEELSAFWEIENIMSQSLMSLSESSVERYDSHTALGVFKLFSEKNWFGFVVDSLSSYHADILEAELKGKDSKKAELLALCLETVSRVCARYLDVHLQRHISQKVSQCSTLTKSLYELYLDRELSSDHHENIQFDIGKTPLPR